MSNDDSVSQGGDDAPEPAASGKRVYVTPVLVTLGTVAEMTEINVDTATIPDRGSS